MNSKTNGVIKWTVTTLIILLPLLLSAQSIEMFFNQNRFLDADGNTIYNFNYKIPNNQLTFSRTEDGFLAMVDVKVNTEDIEENRVELDSFTNHIGVRDREAAVSRTHYYLDKIELTLSKAQKELPLEIEFVDRSSENRYVWSGIIENLAEDALISDLELSHRVVKEEARLGMDKFRRGDYQFYPDPARIFQRGVNDTVFVYFELQNLYPAVDGATYLSEKVRIYNDEYENVKERSIKIEGTTLDMIHRIPADTLNTGHYNLEVIILDRVTNREDKAESYFVVSERHQRIQRIFTDLEQEYQLLRYFLPSSRFRNWETMSDEAKWNFIDRFWTLNDPNPQTDDNEFVRSVRERINYANQNFTHFRDGWETDLGRIYIRNGEPTERERKITDIDTRLTRKEMEVWKYRNTNRVYLFIDIQGNGNYRLIYNRNDDMEPVTSDWERYLGEDFDHSILE